MRSDTKIGRKKLCFAIWSLGVGGAERILIDLVKGIPRERYEIRVICLRERGVYASDLEEAGIPVFCAGKTRMIAPLGLFRLLMYMRRERPDLLNTHLWTADFWARIAGILTGVPTMVVTEHSTDRWKPLIRRIIDRMLFTRTAAAICVGEEVRRFYVEDFGLPPEKVVVIQNGIDLRHFSRAAAGGSRVREECGVDETGFLFVCTARLHPGKAHSVLLESMALLRDRLPTSCRLLIVGDGPARESIEALVDRHGLRRLVTLLGARTDVPAILADADAFVLSSDYEGLSIAILEAMAAALPVVATDVGANSRVIEDGRTGYIVPPRDPRRLAAAMVRLVEDRTAAKQMGRAGRAVVQERYDIAMAVRSTLDLFDRLMRHQPQDPRGRALQ